MLKAVTAVASVVTAAYPIGLIFALNARAVRDYYSGLREPA